MFYKEELNNIEKTIKVGEDAIKILEERKRSLNSQISQKEYELMEILITGKEITDEELEEKENQHFTLVCKLMSTNIILELTENLQEELKKKRYFIRAASQN